MPPTAPSRRSSPASTPTCCNRPSTFFASACTRKDCLPPRIANFGQWREHLLARLRRQVELTADPTLTDLLAELLAYPAPAATAGSHASVRDQDLTGVILPLRLRTEHGLLAFISTTTVFGTPVDVTLAELAIEASFPADPATAATLRRLADDRPRDRHTNP